MKKIFFLPAIIITIIGLLFFTCKKTGQVDRIVPDPVNKPPIANAGPDQVITLPTDSVMLNGNSSFDPDGTINNYFWTKISGPSADIINPTVAGTIVRKLVAGIYQFELKVTDNKGLSAKDTTRIVVNDQSQPNQPPIANAGPDQAITLPADSIVLDGTASTDPDGIITKYYWSEISGPSIVIILYRDSAQTIVKSLMEGIYLFELKITDNGGLTTKDIVQVTVSPAPPLPGCNVNTRPQINATLTEIGTLSIGRVPYAATANNKIVFAGGGVINGPYYIVSPAVDIYDVNSNLWTTAVLSDPKEGIGVATCGNKIFFAGGGFFTWAKNTVNIFDASFSSWTTAFLSEARSYLTAGTIGNKVFFAGGFTDDGPASTRVDIYDLITNTWSTAELSKARCCLTSVTVGNKIYFAGGYEQDGTYSKRVDIYDITTNTWKISELKVLAGPVSSVSIGDKIYWAGITTDRTKGKVEIWNTTTGEINSECLCYARLAPVIAIRNNEIIFLSTGPDWNSEVDFDNNFKPQFDIYNLSTNQWSIGVLPHSIIAPGMVSVNNTIYIGGGRNSRYSTTDKVYTLNW